MQPLEKEIQNSICEYLEYRRGILFWRQNTNPIFDKQTGKPRKMPKFSINGIPDIIVVKGGKFIGLEVKRPKGKQSIDQIDFQMKLQDAGGEYHVVTSIDDVVKLGI